MCVQKTYNIDMLEICIAPRGRKGKNMNRYSYSDLLEAVKKNETAENVNALGEWFEQYGDQFWNGEYYDADGLRLFPVYVAISEEQFEITGYEVR